MRPDLRSRARDPILCAPTQKYGEMWPGGGFPPGESAGGGGRVAPRLRAQRPVVRSGAGSSGAGRAKGRFGGAARGWAGGRRRRGGRTRRSRAGAMAGAERGPRWRLALSSGAPRARLHLLPCAVEHDGAAPVERFFAPAVRSAGEDGEPRAGAGREPGRGRGPWRGAPGRGRGRSAPPPTCPLARSAARGRGAAGASLEPAPSPFVPPPAEPAASFRGRGLKGRQVSLPQGYVGLVVEDDPAAFAASEASFWAGRRARGLRGRCARSPPTPPHRRPLSPLPRSRLCESGLLLSR